MSAARGEQTGGADAAGATRCFRHPNREALVRCTRCDRPICPECMRPASVGFHCPDDVAIARRTQRRQRTSIGAVLRDSPPFATAALVITNVVVYVITGLQSPSGLAQAGQIVPLHSLYYQWQLEPDQVYLHDSYWRFITAAFLHVSLLHIGMNMLALVVIGPTLERLLGPVRFLSVYLLAALGGSVTIYLFGTPAQPVVGASGAIYGLFAACLLMARRLGLDLQWLVGVVVLNFVFTFSVSGISRLGHLGGFVAGALAAVAIGGLPRRGALGRAGPARVDNRIQAAGLGGLLVLLVVLTALGTAFGDY